MSPILRYWLMKGAELLPTRENPLLPVGAPVIQPAAVTMPSGSLVQPNQTAPNRTIGQPLPQPRPKPAKLNMTKTHPLAIT
ncbi:MAG: hypothetical protein EBU46_15875 [Nitrosomonadaceae bacterium]|nr:hypothetical protein [Nitrosomonadaceae bacterium]